VLNLIKGGEETRWTIMQIIVTYMILVITSTISVLADAD